TRIGFGLGIGGEGESVGNREGPDGRRSSALKFWSDDPKSLIERGSGYWQYIPRPDGIRFLTWYDYQTRFGAVGRALDTVLFRPLLGWATAWSFDRLRLWIEAGIDPATSLRQSLVHALARTGIASVWLYQGLVPKLLYRHQDERAMLRDAGVPESVAPVVLRLVGWGEVALGVLFLLAWRSRWLFLANVGLMLAAVLAVARNSRRFLPAAFNPVTLNLAMIVLSLVGFISGARIPTASRCLRRQPAEDG
ncbi:MAG TPA: DoxX-like family protein, partial [Ardenticatenaceae bacterium]|nr:DoxX-like family protein [Ardenticatenaceae bacterium]